MGSARPRPKRLAEKLLQIRHGLGLTQKQLVEHMGMEHVTPYRMISKYENDKNEPPLDILLAYSRLADIHTEILIDDRRDLPKRLTKQ